MDSTQNGDNSKKVRPTERVNVTLFMIALKEVCRLAMYGLVAIGVLTFIAKFYVTLILFIWSLW